MNTSVEALAKLLNFHLDKFGTLGALIALSESDAGRRLVDRVLVGARLQAEIIAKSKGECDACINPRNPKDKGALEAAHTRLSNHRSTH